MSGRFDSADAARGLDTSDVQRLFEVSRNDDIVTVILEKDCTAKGLLRMCEEMDACGPVAILVWGITDTEVILENKFVFEPRSIKPEDIGEQQVVVLDNLRTNLKNGSHFAVIGRALDIIGQARTNC